MSMVTKAIADRTLEATAILVAMAMKMKMKDGEEKGGDGVERNPLKPTSTVSVHPRQPLEVICVSVQQVPMDDEGLFDRVSKVKREPLNGPNEGLSPAVLRWTSEFASSPHLSRRRR